MFAASDPSSAPALAPADAAALPHGNSRLPASVAGAFAAAAYSMQNELNRSQLGDDTQPETAAAETGLLPRLYASRLGKHSADYYLRQFQRFDALNRGLPSWNMAAACFTLAWCSLRGLWRQAAWYLLAVLATAALWFWGLRPLMPATMGYGLAGALWLLAMAVPGLMGNSWYWRKVRAQTLEAVSSSATVAQAHAQLAAQAITPRQQALALLVLALPLAAAAGAGLALLPQTMSSPASESAPAPAIAPPPPVVQPEVPAAPVIPEVPATPAEPSEEALPTEPPAAEPAPSAASENTGLEPGRFYVNVGTFSDPDEAGQALALMEKSKLPALVQTLPSNKGDVSRIRSGPFNSQKRAERAVRKLKPLKLQTSVFQHE
ncbi:MAG: SPOR domain-containing protein [Comamonas sp.]